MRAGAIAVLGAALTAIAGCSGTTDQPGAAEWAVVETPLVTIGALEGESFYLFQSIVDAELLADGRVIVADGGLSVIRVFDAAGLFVAEMGREGDGPGEFQSLRDVWVLGADTIVAWDPRSRRLTYFELRGPLARTVSLQPSAEAAGVGSLDLAVGPLGDGTVALASLGIRDPERLGADRVSVELFGPDGAHLGRVAETTGMVRFRVGERGSAPIPFSPFPRFDTRGSSIYFTNGETPQVMVWSKGSEGVIELPPVDHDLEAAWSGLSERVQEDGREFFQRILSDTPRPDSIPHLAGLMVDESGRVWTKRYEPMTDALWLTGGRTFGGIWWVVDETGSLIAKAAVPDGFAPLDVVGDLILGVTVDAFGVERVQVHRVAK